MSDDAIDDHVETLRELWLTRSDLTFLESGDPALLAGVVAEVQAHRARVEESLRPVYETMAKATRFVPAFMAHKLGGNMSPYVRARVTEHLDPKAAAGLAKHIPPDDLAEISLHLDPQLVARVAAHQDVATLSVITTLIAERGLVKRLGEVADALDERLLTKLIDSMPKAERLAAIATHMQDMDKLARVATKIDKRLRRQVFELLESQGEEVAADAFAD